MDSKKQIQIIVIIFGSALFYWFLYGWSSAEKRVKEQKFTLKRQDDLKNRISEINRLLLDKEIRAQLKNADKKSITDVKQIIANMSADEESRKLDMKPFMINKNDILPLIEYMTVVPNMKDFSIEYISFSEDKIIRVTDQDTTYYQFLAPISLRADFKHFFKYLKYMDTFKKLFIIDSFTLSYNDNVEYLASNFKMKFFINQDNDAEFKIEEKNQESFSSVDLSDIEQKIIERRKKTVLKRNWDKPVLRISDYENPDKDGRFVLSWEALKEVEYLLYENGREIKNPLTPYTVDLEENGKYVYQLKGKTYDEQLIESDKLLVVIDIEPLELPFLQGVVAIDGKNICLIDNKIFREGNEVNGFIISSIQENKVVLKFKNKEYELKLPESK